MVTIVIIIGVFIAIGLGYYFVIGAATIIGGILGYIHNLLCNIPGYEKLFEIVTTTCAIIFGFALGIAIMWFLWFIGWWSLLVVPIVIGMIANERL